MTWSKKEADVTMLAGCKVLDLTVSDGLMTGRILADHGADVVVVEPVAGSPARTAEPGPAHRNGDSYVWEAFAANKRSVAFDLGLPSDRGRLMGLIEQADVLIDEHASTCLQELGLGWRELHNLNERLVLVSVSAFGATGPKSAYADTDLILWAAGGPLQPHRDGERPPVRPSVPQAYRLAAADAAAGALLALLSRAATGRGQRVDVSVQACLPSATLGMALTHAVGDFRESTGSNRELVRRADRSGSGSGSPSATRKWQVLDGLVEFHVGMGPSAGKFTTNFFRWLLAEGEPVQKYVDLDWRLVADQIESGEFTDEQVEDARVVIRAFLARKTKAEILDAAVTYKLLSVPIFTTEDLAESEQMASRDFYVDLIEPRGNSVRVPGQPSAISPGEFSIQRRAPRLGEHTEEVLAEWSAALAQHGGAAR